MDILNKCNQMVVRTMNWAKLNRSQATLNDVKSGDSHLNDYMLFNEDCIETASRLSAGSVDLIYADPPFFSGRRYEVDGRQFDDRWKDVPAYLSWMSSRLHQFERILRPTGSLYLHCDWHISHYLKVLADSIFGQNRFLNEIVWKRQSSHNDVRQGSRHYGRVHDTLLVYVMSREYVWNQQYAPYDESYVKRAYRHHDPKSGRRFALTDLTAPGGATKGNTFYEFLGVKRYWRYSHSKMQKLLESGRIYWHTGNVPLSKRYLDEMQGKPIQDVWLDIKPISTSRESMHFPTQKPEALLSRIVKTSTLPTQRVYDPFSGSGSLGVSCYRLGRKWIGSEISKSSCSLIANRLATLGCDLSFRKP